MSGDFKKFYKQLFLSSAPESVVKSPFPSPSLNLWSPQQMSNQSVINILEYQTESTIFLLFHSAFEFLSATELIKVLKGPRRTHPLAWALSAGGRT